MSLTPLWKTMAARTASGRKLNGRVKNNKDHEHDGCSSEMRPLTAAACSIYHGGLGGAAVDHEGATATRGNIGKREADQVHILVEAITVAESIGL